MPTESTALFNASASHAGEGTLLSARYALEERLDHGRLGRVFRALDHEWSRTDGVRRDVEVLVLPAEIARDPRQLAAFEREFSTLQALSHENLVELYDFDRDGDVRFVVMEWVDGETLRSVVDCLAPERLSEDDLVHVVRRIGDALTHLHDRGLTHGDVRADNVLVTERGGVRLLLASSCLARSAPFSIEPRDDVFALAVLAYELLAGTAPPAAGIPRGDRHADTWRIDRLDRAQWSTLREALTPRDSRVRTIRQFLDGMGWAREQVMSAADPRSEPRSFAPEPRDVGPEPVANVSEPPSFAAEPPPFETERPFETAPRYETEPSRWESEPIQRDVPRGGAAPLPPHAAPPAGSARPRHAPPSRSTAAASRMEPTLEWVEPRLDPRYDYRAAQEYAAASVQRSRRPGIAVRLIRRAAVAVIVMAGIIAVVAGALRVDPERLESMAAALLPAPAGTQDGGAPDTSPSGTDRAAMPAAAEPVPSGGSELTIAAPAPSAGSEPAAERGGPEPERSDDAATGAGEGTTAVAEAAGAETGLRNTEPRAALPAAAPARRLSFGRSEVVATEGQSVVPIELRRADASGEMMVAWWTEDGSATAPDDYADFGRVVETFRNGERSRTIFIPITADSLPEDTEEFYVYLSELSGNGRQRGELLRATVTIMDDDH